MNRYKEMRAFLAVVKEGSLTAAGIKEGITASMIGRHIDSLERRLGIRLLHRTTRHLSLTEQGVFFLKHCQELVTEIDVREAEMFPDIMQVTGRLTVLAPPHFGRHHVAVHAGAFLAAHPNVQLSFNLSNDYADPTTAEYDLCIRIGNVIDPRFVTTKLLSNKRVVCATPAYFERFGTPRTLEDLARHNCLGVNLRAGLHREWLFQENGKPVSVKVEGTIDCNDADSLIRWARDGLGLAWRSTWEIGAEIADGRLVTVLDDYALPSFDITAVYPRDRPLKSARLFAETLKSAYSQPGYWTVRA
ncbi:LysR family transcriptional regulator [Shinella pollutisoli]|uniref:LysR family transcriptional regulator n=1 Tax=Shinella pollutisoli TaxID=2250594 RepID=A0ABV7DH25_9HYPH